MVLIWPWSPRVVVKHWLPVKSMGCVWGDHRLDLAGGCSVWKEKRTIQRWIICSHLISNILLIVKLKRIEWNSFGKFDSSMRSTPTCIRIVEPELKFVQRSFQNNFGLVTQFSFWLVNKLALLLLILFVLHIQLGYCFEHLFTTCSFCVSLYHNFVFVRLDSPAFEVLLKIVKTMPVHLTFQPACIFL